MPKLEDHPTVLTIRSRPPQTSGVAQWTAEALRSLALEAGADDAGVVQLDRSELDADRHDILAAMPAAKSALSFVVRMNREPIRSTARSIANLEFHHAGDEVNDIARRIVTRLEQAGVAALNPAMGFPMEIGRFPGKIWTVSHKRVAEAAGLGRMGIHRNLIHSKFGNFILLGTVLTDIEVEEPAQDRPLDYNPCLECKLCVAACPVGAISPDGEFNFSSCYTHNYREFMGGFTEWVERVADSKDARDYRSRVEDGESASVWQSLSYGANYKAAYCLAVCPAGEDVIAPFLDDRKSHLDAVVRPLQKKVENIYVVPGSDAEAHTAKRYPHKRLRPVANSLRPVKIEGFLGGLPLVFQPGRSEGLNAVYHFVFRGEEQAEATVTIRNRRLTVERGLKGAPDLTVRADSRAWLAFLRKDRSLAKALLTGKVRLKGSPRLLVRFGKCFLG